MLQIKDEHNDELFRRAAENYPLKTDSADWEALQKKIDAAPVDDDQPETEPKRKKRRFLWLLLLLIPLTLFELKYPIITKNFTGKAGRESAASKTNNLDDAGSQDSEKKKTGQQLATMENEGEETAPTIDEQHKVTASKTPAAKMEPEGLHGNQPANSNFNADADAAFARQKNKQHTGSRSRIKIKQGAAVEDDETVARKKTVKKDPKKQKISMKAAIPSEEDEAKTVTAMPVKTEKSAPPAEAIKTITPDVDSAAIAITADETQNTLKEKEVAGAKDSINNKTVKTEDKPEKSNQDKSKKHEKHFYIGLLAGPDLSTIKLQSVKKVGLNYGFVAGYRINKRFSVETGIFKAKKYYGTDSKYFDLKKLNLPANATIGYVDGVCNMLEVPVNVTYTIRPGSKASWFSTVGISSYFMQNESYKFDVYRWGYAYPYDEHYDNKSSHLFAVINISAGFTYKIGKIADLRIEPFIKLPVNKIGTGSLPIQSAGILAGFTKTIF